MSERASPVIVVVEDIHWADEPTFDMLKFLSRRIQNSQVLLIPTFRDDERDARRLLDRLTGDLPPKITVRIPLAALSESTVAHIEQRAQRLVEGLFELTGRNPLFVTDMLESEA